MQSLLRTTDLLRSRHAAAARLFPSHHKHNPSSASASAYYPLGDDDNNGDGHDDGDEDGDDHGDGTASADVVPEYEYHDMARAGLGSWGVAVRLPQCSRACLRSLLATSNHTRIFPLHHAENVSPYTPHTVPDRTGVHLIPLWRWQQRVQFDPNTPIHSFPS